MEANYISAGQLLTLQAPFRVPKYQRGFAWESNQVRDFTDDLKFMVEAHPGTNPHFFGGVVSVMRNDPMTPAGVAYDVVDGQQRLTVFTLAVHALIRGYRAIALEGADSEDESVAKTTRLATTMATNMEANYLRYSAFNPDGSEAKPLKLSLSRVDRDYLEELLTADSLPKATAHSHRLLRRAASDIYDALVLPIVGNEAIGIEEKYVQLEAHKRALVDSCAAIHIVSEDQNEAYQLFQVLNNRGKSLTDAELIRTRTLQLLENFEAQQLAAEEHWEPIVRGKPGEVSSFLRSFYASTKGLRASNKDLYDSYDRAFLPSDSAATLEEAKEVKEWVTNLGAEYEDFLLLRSGAWPFPESQVSLWERNRLTRLIKALKVTAALPVLLSACRKRDETFFVELVTVLERFSFRYIVSNGHPSQMADKLYEEARAVREDPSYDVARLKSVCRQLLLKYARDSVFKSQMSSRLRYSTSGNNSLLRYFLIAVEDHYDWLQHGPGSEPKPTTLQVFDWGEVKIEHIYPQRPRFNEDDPSLKPLVHSLGNLAFWGPDLNPQASNFSFETKKEKYYPRSQVNLIKELAAVSSWSADEVNQREMAFIKWALRLFPIPEGVEEDESEQTTWLVQQNPGSAYRDSEGELYDYPYDIPLAQHISEGDMLVCYLGGKHADEDRRVFGIGRVGRLVPDGDRVLAVYEAYGRIDPAATFEELGGDPRNNLQNSINRVEIPDFLGNALHKAGYEDAEHLPAVSIEMEHILKAIEEAGASELASFEDELGPGFE